MQDTLPPLIQDIFDNPSKTPDDARTLPPYFVFGFDLGPGSLGWCVCDRANRRIIALNTLIFPVPQGGQKKESLAAQRGECRRHRRTLNRRQARLARCLKILADHDIIEPAVNDEGDVCAKAGGKAMQPRKGEREPLYYRVKGLDKLLTDRELARVVYSLCGHRGYIDRGDGILGDGGGGEDGKVRIALKENAEAMKEGGCRTVGELLVKRALAAHEPIRSRNKGGDYSLCMTNAQLCDELRFLFERQRALGNAKATEGLCKQLVDECMTYLTDCTERERRTYESVALCPYYGDEGEKAAARACLTSEMTNAYESLRNVRVVSRRGAKGEPLPDEVVEKCIERIFSTKAGGEAATRLTYAKLRKMLDLGENGTFKGVPKASEQKRDVYTAKAWNALRARLPEPLLSKLRGDRGLADAVSCVLTYSSSEKTLRGVLEGEADVPIPAACLEPLEALSVEEIEAIESLPYASKVFSGYGSRSLRALGLILSHFVGGAQSLTEILENTGLRAKEEEAGTLERGDLLCKYSDFDPQCNNPVVLRAMANFRRVVNALIKRYGRPAEIHLELANELKKPKRVRDEIDRANRKRKDANKVRAELAAGLLGCSPSDVPYKVLMKLEFLEEQNDRDAYTGEEIDKARLVRDSEYAQIDHIIPYSQSYDDSRANKVVVLAKTNQDKGNRSPYEWLGGGRAWEKLEKNVAGMKNLSERKLSLILCQDAQAASEGFIARNLNDTRYMTRHAAQWLGECLEFADGVTADGKPLKDHVICPAGAITSKLRRLWGLSRKDREKDNMHHAVDAAIIAVCTQSIIQKTAIAYSRRHMVRHEEYKAAMRAAMPWPGFAEEVEALAAQAIPARSPRRRVGGAAFKETTYRVEKADNGNGKAVLAGVKDPCGNCKLDPDGKSAKVYGGLAFLQLWWDPQGKIRGRKEPGCWLADPVYCADIPDYLAEPKRYKPRAGKKSGTGRNAWPEVPKHARGAEPMKIFPGDMLEVKGELRLFVGYDISNLSWTLVDPRRVYTDPKARSEGSKSGLTIAKCGKNEIRRVDVGPLGFPGEPLEDEGQLLA